MSYSKLLILLSILNILVYLIVRGYFEDTLTKIDTIKRKLDNNKADCDVRVPTLIYEKKRRRIRSTIEFLWISIKHQIHEMKKKNKNSRERLSRLLGDIYGYKISLMSDWKQMSLNDGYEKWRQTEFRSLNKLIQKRLYNLMNPKDCTTAKVLLCPQWSLCGWGCQTFDYAQKLAIAFGLKRFLSFARLPDSSLYNGTDLFTKYYEPISETCDPDMYQNEIAKWSEANNSKVLTCPIKLSSQDNKFLKYTFQAVPKDLLPRLEKITDVPAVWFVSQLEDFLLKLKPEYENYIEHVAKKIKFKHPIVGVHVRRAGKKGEAPNLPLSQYMDRVREFYDTLKLTQKVPSRRVFLATDDVSVIGEAIKFYSKNYEIIFNMNSTMEAGNIEAKYKNPLGIMTDIDLLAKCDHFVGTFSSNIDRRVLEFMYRLKMDAPERISTLDRRHFESYLDNFTEYKVLVKHQPLKKNELQAEVGDIIRSSDFNMLTGWTYASLDNRAGIIPSYKIEELQIGEDF